MENIPSPIESTKEKIARLRSEVLKHMDIMVFNKKMIAFIEKIKEDHSDYKRYRCYHQLMGSGIEDKGIIKGDFEGFFEDKADNKPKETSNIIEEDFEGDDSVAGFLEGLLKKE